MSNNELSERQQLADFYLTRYERFIHHAMRCEKNTSLSDEERSEGVSRLCRAAIRNKRKALALFN